VRLATPADVRALAELRHEFRTTLDPLVAPEAGFQGRCAAWMAARLLQDDVWRCWVAEADTGPPHGMVWVQFLEKLPNPVHEPELHAYLTSFYVRPLARNRGVGSALLETALSVCAERGVDTVFLWPTPRSRVLYLRHGFTEQADLLERRFRSARPYAGGGA
jgi:GNAT superfamily N-acetyltransferase